MYDPEGDFVYYHGEWKNTRQHGVGQEFKKVGGQQEYTYYKG
jgi:hypothetical protein